jgi:carbon-monoxide dehydrogenase medium subunit
MLSELDGAKLIAGGQSLVPMLNMRYVFVENLIDINRVQGLSSVERPSPDVARIGAMTRQRDILADPLLRDRAPVVGEALRFVGHLHTRNRGTIGGSLAHMDPAAELMNIATLLDATVHVESARGGRDIAIGEFPLAFMTPQLGADEMIVAVSFNLPRAGHGWSFHEFAQRHGDFAIVAVGAIVEVEPDGLTVADARIVLSGVDFAPQRLRDAEDILKSRGPEATGVAAACAAGVEAISDAMASGAYRQHLARILTGRALSQAFDRARGASLQ